MYQWLTPTHPVQQPAPGTASPSSGRHNLGSQPRQHSSRRQQDQQDQDASSTTAASSSLLYHHSTTSDFPTALFHDSISGFTPDTTPPTFSFDDSHLWAEDASTTTATFGDSLFPTATGTPATRVSDDFDWTALGLDCFGTQLRQPGHLELGLESRRTDSSLQQQTTDLLFGGSIGDETAMSAIDTTLNLDTTGGDHLFANFSTSSQAAHNNAIPNSAATLRTTPTILPSAQASASPSHSTSSSSEGASTSGTKRTAAAASGEEEGEVSAKRQRNTQAARRYRQRRVDRLADLEKQLAEMTSERDDLRVKLARREAEVGALREVMGSSKK